MVLLANEGGGLPLQPAASWCEAGFVLAVLGPHAEATEALLGNYHGGPPFVVSPLAGLKKLLGQRGLPCKVKVQSSLGCQSVKKCSAELQQEATDLAARASVTVIVLLVASCRGLVHQCRGGHCGCAAGRARCAAHALVRRCCC